MVGRTGMIARALVRIACAPIPADRRSRYVEEWDAEVAAVRDAGGRAAAVAHAVRLALGGPRTALVIRNPGSPDSRAAFVCFLAVAIPSAVFVLHGLLTAQPLVFAGHLGLFAGVVILGRGVWRGEPALFQSWTSRLGLMLSLASGVTISVVNLFTDVDNPVTEAPYRVVAGSSIAQAGVLLLLLSGTLGQLRNGAVRLGLGLVVCGCVVWATLGLVNLIVVDMWSDRLYHGVSIPSLLAVAAAGWAALSKREIVFDRTSIGAIGQRPGS